MFEPGDIPHKCDAVLKARKQGQKAPNRSAVKVHIPTAFVYEGVDYLAANNRWIRKTSLVVSADDALRANRVPGGSYWFWLERD